MKPTVKPHQRLFFHPTFHPKDISRKSMQEMYSKTCGEIFKDLLDVKQLTIAYHRPQNLRDLLMPSKLKTCDGEENQVQHYLQTTNLADYINEITYETTRKREIEQEKDHLQSEVQRINQVATKAHKRLVHNPYTKKYQWTYNQM